MVKHPLSGAAAEVDKYAPDYASKRYSIKRLNQE